MNDIAWGGRGEGEEHSVINPAVWRSLVKLTPFVAEKWELFYFHFLVGSRKLLDIKRTRQLSNSRQRRYDSFNEIDIILKT